MKCQKCGAPSHVLATRPHLTVFLKRSRECFNHHRFTTYEVYVSSANPVAMKSAAKGVAARAKLYKVKMKIWASNLRACDLARKLGVTQQWVYAVRKQGTTAFTNVSLPTAASPRAKAKTPAAGSGPDA